jgi:glycolate oxidase FAD binding subunit
VSASDAVASGSAASAPAPVGPVASPASPISADAAARVVDLLRAAATAAGGHAVVLSAPRSVRDGIDMWGPVPGLDLMRRVKDQFDPDHRFAPGRFVGGI